MKILKKVKNQFIKDQALLPSELLNLPTVMVTGNRQITIEQHEKLIAFSDKEIILQYENGKIQIKGETLTIKMMYAREIILEGTIEKIIFIH